jgi:IPT/TIG domain
MQIIVDPSKINAVKAVLRGLNISAEVHLPKSSSGGSPITVVNLEGRSLVEFQGVYAALKGNNLLSTTVVNPVITTDEIANPAPTLTSLNPSSVAYAGSGAPPPGITLQVAGTNFAQGARIYFRGGTLPTNFVNPTLLTCTITKADTRPGTYSVYVINNDSQHSNTLPFTAT